MKEQLCNFLVHSSGKPISKRYTTSAFSRYNLEHLVAFVNEQTIFWPVEYDFALRCWAVVNDKLTIPSCITCGSLIKNKNKNGWLLYCDKVCRNTDPNLSNILKNNFKKVDTNAASEKRKATNFNKFGVAYPSQRESHKQALRQKAAANRDTSAPLLDDKEWLYQQHIQLRRNVVDIANDINVHYGTVIEALQRLGIIYNPRQSGYNKSSAELEISEFLSLLNVDHELSNRKVIDMELDLYIPDKNLAIEYNGLYWHSIGREPSKIYPTYHLEKTNRCLDKGIRLIHINEHEWLNKPEIVKSMLSHAVGISGRRISARSCTFTEVTPKLRKDFFEDNHIDGDSTASYSYGLLYQGELICCVSVGKPRFTKHADWEIIRFASKLNTSVVGGFGKIFSKIKEHHKGKILSYANRMKGSGGVYKTVGFKFEGNTKVGYYWTDKKTLFHRSKFMKSKLSKALPNFDVSKSERDNMLDHGWRQFYDCGHSRWVFDNT